MKILRARYIKSIKSFFDRKGLPYPEICFIGRSNVGKSSMINRLLMQRIARTSSTPGATQLINLYEVFYEHDKERGQMVFSDFPGFGYSRVTKRVHQGWQEMIEAYIKGNNLIRRLIWVYDVRREMDELDGMLIDWVNENSLNFTLVLTKIDKVSSSDMSVKRRLFENLFGKGRVFVFSSKDGYGRDELLSHVISSFKPVRECGI